MSYTRPKVGAHGSAKAPLVPKANYRVAVLKIDNAPSKSTGATMVTANVQILAPESVTNPDGSVSKTAGFSGDLRFVFSEKNLANCIDALTKLEVSLPPEAGSFDEDVRLMAEALAARLNQLTFELVVQSKAEPQRGPAGEELRDGNGNVIMGMERPDFNMFNIVGLPKTFKELGVVPQNPY